MTKKDAGTAKTIVKTSPFLIHDASTQSTRRLQNGPLASMGCCAVVIAVAIRRCIEARPVAIQNPPVATAKRLIKIQRVSGTFPKLTEVAIIQGITRASMRSRNVSRRRTGFDQPSNLVPCFALRTAVVFVPDVSLTPDPELFLADLGRPRR